MPYSLHRLAAVLASSLLLLGCPGDDDPRPVMDSSLPDAPPPQMQDAEPPMMDAAVPDAEVRPPPFVGPTGPSMGCGVMDSPRGRMDRTIVAARIEREFILVVPDGYDANTPVSLVFAWHGLGGNASNFSRLRFEEESGDDAIIVYPNGRPSVGGANGWDIAVDGRDVALFDAIWEELSGSYCIEQGRVFSTGFSYGGFFSNTLGCARGNVVRAIGPVGAAPTARSGCMGQVAAIVIHGETDAVISFSLGESARDLWMAKNGCSTETSAVTGLAACESFDGCDEGYPVQWCTHTGGHTYPSWGRRALWEFFSSL